MQKNEKEEEKGQFQNSQNNPFWSYFMNNNKPKMANSCDLPKMAIMDYRGLSWTIIDYHGLSWTIMDYHGLSWTIVD